MDHQLGTFGASTCIRCSVAKAVILFGIGNNDEPVIGERAIDHFLDLCGGERNLFLIP